MTITVGELKKYIEENLANGKLKEDSEIELETFDIGEAMWNMVVDNNVLKLSTLPF